MWAHWDIPSLLNIWDERKWSCEPVQGAEMYRSAFPCISNLFQFPDSESIWKHGLSWIYVDFYGFMMHLICRPWFAQKPSDPTWSYIFLKRFHFCLHLPRCGWCHWKGDQKWWWWWLWKLLLLDVQHDTTCLLKVVQWGLMMLVHYSYLFIIILYSILFLLYLSVFSRKWCFIIVYYIVLLLCWDWNTGWEDCGREFLHGFLQDSWVSYGFVLTHSWGQKLEALAAIVAPAVYVDVLWCFVNFIQGQWKNIGKHMKNMKTYENNWKHLL